MVCLLRDGCGFILLLLHGFLALLYCVSELEEFFLEDVDFFVEDGILLTELILLRLDIVEFLLTFLVLFE